MNKNDARKFIKEKKRALSKEEILDLSKKLSLKFFELPCYKECSMLLCYLSYNQEIETRFIIERALSDGKTLAVPKVTGEGEMEFHLYDKDDIALGYQGIPEPSGKTAVVAPTDAVMLMPGLAFDKTGNRIGYGGGFYDRYLSRASSQIVTVELAYDFQILENLEVEEFDKKVDIIINL